MRSWIVMSSVEVAKNNGRSFETNATNLTEAEADAEAARRNKVEKDAGHKGITWFKCEDPMAALKRLGIDTSILEGMR